MRARPIHDQYARLPWLIAAMTVVALTIGALAAWHVEQDLVASALIRSMPWTLAAAWALVWLPMLAVSIWSAMRLRAEWSRAQETQAHATDAESKYRQLVEQASDIIYRVDLHGYFTYINSTVTRFKGYTQEELIGQHFTEHIRPDAREAARRFYLRQFARKTPSTYYEFPVIKKDGGEIWFGQNVQLLMENDQVVGFQAVARDITERKRTDEAMRSTTEFLRTLVQASPLAIVNLDPDSNVTSWNRAAEDMLGWSETEVLGKPLPYIPPGKEAEADALWAESLQGPGASGVEIRRRKKDGTPIDLEIWSRTFRNEQGMPVLSFGILADITERKQAEERLAKINECFLNFGINSEININNLTALCGELLGAACALYNYLDGPLLRSIGKWNAPPGFNPVDPAVGHICHDVIREGGDCPRTVHNLPETRYARTDPNVLPYKLQTYFGMAVKCQNTAVGSLCAVFQRDYVPSEADAKLLGIIAAAIGVEEERRRGNETLRESQERFSKSFNEAPIGMALVATDGRFIQVNRALSQIVGYSENELLATKFQAITHPDDLEADLTFVRHMLNGTMRTYQMEKRYIHKLGHVVWILLSVSLVHNAELKPLYFIGQIQDITKRKQAEEEREQLVKALAESRNRFEMFFRQTPSAISITTIKDGRFLDVNKHAEVLTGYTREELIGRTTVEMNLYVDPTERPGLVQELKQKGMLTDLEREIRTKSGEIRTAIFSLVPIMMGSEPCMLSIAHDITERKQAEQRLHERSRQQAIEAELSLLAVSVGDSANLLSTAAGMVSNALEVNYCEVLELIPNGTDLRLCASAGWRGDDIGQVRALETGSPAHAALNSSNPVVRTLPKNARFGGPAWLHEHGTVTGMSVSIPGKDGPWGVLGVYTAATRAFSRDDVNFLQTISSILATAIERMQAEIVLRSANQSLRLLSRQLLQVQEDDRRAIARDLHDEIGQSLTAIKLNVERAQRAADRDTRTHILRDCAQITEHVLGQVRNLSLDLHPSILDDLGLAYALKWYADRQAERAGLKVELTADPSLPRLPQDVEITCFRIAQEALTNVVRHAHARLVGIALKREVGSVELCIQDDGIGFVVDKASAPVNGKSSIGLVSMQERAKLLGGTLKITSAPDCGTTVLATLPLPVVSLAGMPTEEVPRS
ncbi:MAG TPA: PAS domain S-box protein [Nitrospiraceae bacterium]